MLGKVVCRPPKAIFDLNSNETHTDDMAKLEPLSNLLPEHPEGRAHTPANTIHQSSHPTLLTSHIRVTKRNAIKIRTVLRASIDVASKPPDLSASPIAGGVVGFSMIWYTGSVTTEIGNGRRFGCKNDMTILLRCWQRSCCRQESRVEYCKWKAKAIAAF